MASVSDKSYRQLLEEVHTSQIKHEARHEVRDPLLDKCESAIWGNGKVGLKSKVHLLMAAMAIAILVVGGAVTDIILRR